MDRRKVEKKEVKKPVRDPKVTNKQLKKDFENSKSRFSEGKPVAVDLASVKLVNKPKK